MIGEDERRAAALRPANERHLQVRQRCARVGRLQARIVPIGDFAENHVNVILPRQFQLRIARQVIADDDAAAGEGMLKLTEFHRSLVAFAELVADFHELLPGQCFIGGTEIDEPLFELLDARPAADRLIVDAATSAWAW